MVKSTSKWTLYHLSASNSLTKSLWWLPILKENLKLSPGWYQKANISLAALPSGDAFQHVLYFTLMELTLTLSSIQAEPYLHLGMGQVSFYQKALKFFFERGGWFKMIKRYLTHRFFVVIIRFSYENDSFSSVKYFYII